MPDTDKIVRLNLSLTPTTSRPAPDFMEEIHPEGVKASFRLEASKWKTFPGYFWVLSRIFDDQDVEIGGHSGCASLDDAIREGREALAAWLNVYDKPGDTPC